MSVAHVRRLVDARKRLAAEGLYTFLVHGIDPSGKCDCGKPDCKSPGKHPRFKGGNRGATINPAQIERETAYSHANIGLHCGLSGLVIVDIDPRNGGWDTLEAIQAQHGPLDGAIVAETGGGGRHIYFLASEGVAYPSSLGAGVDVQSGNKYVIVPPSRHHSGKPYRWQEGADPESGATFLTHFPDAFLKPAPPAVAEPDERELDETDGEIARLKSALETISADCSRNDWLLVLLAIHSTGWSCAEEIAREWSMTAPQLWDEQAFAAVWKSASASRDGGRTVRSIYYTAARNGWIDPDASTYAETLGDIDNGHRFAKANRGRLVYVGAAREWREYRNGIWRRCETGEEVTAAKAIAEANLREAAAQLSANPSDSSKATYSQALKVHRSAPRIAAMIDMAKAERGMTVADPTAFDRDQYMLGVEGGAIDLRTGQWLAPSPKHMLSKSVGVRFDPAARCPRWERFLADILEDRERVAFVQRFAGYSLTGLVDEEKLLFMHGTGANGKSVMANVLAAVFGEYAVTVGSELLSVTKNDGEASRFKHRLQGARLALVNEVGQADTFNDQRVKEIVSREAIPTRALYGEAFDFIPSHTIWVRGNHRPAVRDAGDGMWRRLLLLFFGRQFAPEERVRDLDRQLLAEEGPGILNWLIAGSLQWQKSGLQTPPSILQETAMYRDDTDVIGDWLATECIVKAGARCSIVTIFASYQNYIAALGMSPMTRPAFVRMMGTRGFRRKTSNGNSYLAGIDVSFGDL